MLTTLSIPSSLIGGTAVSSPYVLINGPAPAGGLTVTLTSNNAAASVPATMTISAGATGQYFTLTTFAVTVPTNVTLSASIGGITVTAPLVVMPVQLSYFTLAPTSGVGGYPVTGTVGLTAVAPAGGTMVSLSSDAPAGSPPASVTVPAGASSVGFSFNTSTVASTTLAHLTASCGGATNTASLTIYPATPITCGQTLSGVLVAGNTDYYTMTEPAGKVVTLTLSSSSFLPRLLLTNTSNSLLASNYNGTGAATITLVYPIPSGGAGTYIIAVTTGTANGAGPYTLTLSCSDVAPPTNLTATAGNALVNLTWTFPTGATGANIYRSTTSGGPYSQILTNITPQAYASGVHDTTVTNNTTYYYVATALSPSGESSFSNEAAATPNSNPLGTPALTAKSGDSRVVLSWYAVSGATGYSLYRGTTSGAEGSTPYLTGLTGTTYVDTGLTNGTTYYYRLMATTTSTHGTPSNEAMATPNVLPAGPILAAHGTTGQVTLTWTSVSGAASYNLYLGSSAGQEVSTPYLTGLTGTSYLHTGLSNSFIPFYKLTAVATGPNGAEGSPSNEATASPVSSPVLTATAGDTQVLLSWGAIIHASSYNLYRSTTPGGEGAIPYQNNLVGTTYTDTTLTDGVTYYYQLTAVGTNSESIPSNEMAATPNPPAATPTGLTARGSTSQVTPPGNAVPGLEATTSIVVSLPTERVPPALSAGSPEQPIPTRQSRIA